MDDSFDVAVIGGGFFGCMLALYLRQRQCRVVVLERGAGLLGRASYNNQARVHHGYHYPRSWRTAWRSRINFPRFVRQFEDCIDASFAKFYAVPYRFSKVTARQFVRFFEGLGNPLAPAAPAIRKLFNPDLIEAVFQVTEYAFDACRLRDFLIAQAAELGVDVRLNVAVAQVRSDARGRLRLATMTSEGPAEVVAGEVFNCTYAQMNQVLADSELPLIPLQQELTEMALVEPPDELRRLGVTVMCGPFFSLMPFPPRGLHTLSHVRFTPHAAWSEGTTPYRSAYTELVQAERVSSFPFMVRDAARFLPAVRGCRYVDSLWEIKTVLPRSQQDDSRPILLKRHHGLPNLHCVLGAKLDNVYDLFTELDAGAGEARRCG